MKPLSPRALLCLVGPVVVACGLALAALACSVGPEPVHICTVGGCQ